MRLMRNLLISFLFSLALQQCDCVVAADTVIVPKDSGNAFLKDVGNNLLPLNVSYTTDGSGHLKLINSANPVDDDIVIPKDSGKAYLNGADGNLYPVQVIYTTDGNGNVMPVPAGGGGGSGTVTSVGLALPSIFNISGSPVTTSGTLTGSLANESANLIFAGPSTGVAAAPTFRSLVSADIPALSYVSSVGATAPIVSSGGLTPSLSCNVASGSQPGCLSSADWSTFNGKQNALTFGNLSDVGTDGITVSNGTGAVIGTGTSVAQHVADSTHNGYLSSTDWSTFNAKQPAGNYITALTGDVVATGPGSVASTLTPFVNYVYVDLASGNDSTGNGSPLKPWKTIQHTCNTITPTINIPITIHVAGGNNDTDTNPITCPPNISIVADEGIQLVGLTISGGITNDGVFLRNIIIVNNFSWVRNDNSAITVTFDNSGTFGSIDFEQQGAGTPSSALFMYGANAYFFGGATFQLGEVIFQGIGAASGVLNYKDSGSATFLLSGGADILATIQLHGGTNLVLAGNISDSGYSIVGTTTGSGTPTVKTDSASLPASVSGVTVSGNEARSLAGLGAQPATNASLIVNNGHVKATQTTAPTATVSANAGTGATCTVSNATDIAGQINLSTNSVAAATGVYCTVNFNKSYNVAPICTLSPGNAVTAQNSSSFHQIYFGSTTAGLTVNFGVAENTSSSYVWYYHCIETQ